MESGRIYFPYRRGMTPHRFLCTWKDSESQERVAFEVDPSPALKRTHGRASKLFPANGDEPLSDLSNVSHIAFIVSSDPSSILAILLSDLSPDLANAVRLTYGHASIVLLLESTDQWQQVLEATVSLITGHEIWSIHNVAGVGSVVADVQVDRPVDRVAEVFPADISTNALGAEATAQVQQFNANIAVLGRVIRRYAPEAWPLVERLHDHVADIVDRIRQLDFAADINAARAAGVQQSVLVETNAVVTLYTTQLGSGTLPLRRSRFAVGEHSLLGIGLPSRAAWHYYHHLNKVFAEHGHSGRLAKMATVLDPFDWAGPASAIQNFDSWEALERRLNSLSPEAETSPRMHIPHFSSRWGFHESLHSISFSWQCISASATKQWNLLTLTHEYLHSEVRAISNQIIRPTGGEDIAMALVERYNSRDMGKNFAESLQMAYVEALILARGMREQSRNFRPGDYRLEGGVPRTITAAQLFQTVRTYTDVVHEILVHVLDFKYVFASREQEYIEAIWSSWALVPSVADSIEYYVMRTLCALSASNRGENALEIFEEEAAKAQSLLTDMRGRLAPDSLPAIDAAIATLTDADCRKRMSVEFVGLRYTVHLALCFFYDQSLHFALMRDECSVTDGTKSSYNVAPGDYTGIHPQSPINFLLDQFSSYSHESGTPAVERHGVWQLLHLL